MQFCFLSQNDSLTETAGIDSIEVDPGSFKRDYKTKPKQTLKYGDIKILALTTKTAVEEAINDGSDALKIAESAESDLIPNQYEGGMKIWECTHDLANYLINLNLNWENLSVLDLGCGSGILGILSLKLGAKKVVFQDYNIEVLKHLTMANVFLNMESFENIKFFSGDWDSFREICQDKFDLILTSETIYNPGNYKKILNIILKFLNTNGKCFLAAKSAYFGVGGSVQGFKIFLEDSEKLSAIGIWKSSEGLLREILEIAPKN